MERTRACAKCGAPLSVSSVLDICPRCVAAQILATDDAVAGAPSPRPAPCPTVAEAPGDWIGPYKLLQKIGEGGCGVVYMAEQQEPVRRRVALKIIKLGMDSRQVIARFEAERQALALMDHPHIARFFDAGVIGESRIKSQTETKTEVGGQAATQAEAEKIGAIPREERPVELAAVGRPYFVMELVRGVRITEYCDQHHLSTEQRLALFIQVCQAVQHAHHKGIIHRDLKPSNILVTINDGVAVPKIIDFGIAKATEQPLTDKTLFTEFHQFIGTPAYMSPEQALMSSLDVDTRSDIYSLGVLLYELLTGHPPFDPQELRRAGLNELCRTIREQEPPKPSTRLSTLTPGDRTTVAQRRSTDGLRLIHAVRGDLDWLVMKSLEKDRTRRYESASALAADIERHLRNEPIMARPPSTLYLLRKTFRRNRVSFVAAGTVALTVLVALAVSTGLLIRERSTRRRAEFAEGRALTNAQRVTELARENRERLVRLQIETGARHLREMDLMGALPWFVEAFKLDPQQEKNANRHQSRLASLLQECPRPLQMFFPTGSISAAAFSPDGGHVISLTRNQQATLWDSASGRFLSGFHSDQTLNSVRFSPDGRFAAIETTGSSFLWDLGIANSGAAARPLEATSTVTSVSRPVVWNSAGYQFLTIDERNVVTLRDGATGAAWQRFRHQSEARILVAAFVARELATSRNQTNVATGYFGLTKDGAQTILTVNRAGQLDFWDATSGQHLAARNLEPKSSPWDAAYLNADGSRLLTVHNPDDSRAPPHARLWSTRACRPIGEPLSHDSLIHAPIFGSNCVITCSRDRTARVWDTRNGALRFSPLNHASDVTVMAFSPDQHLLLTGCADGSARVWSMAIGRPVGPPLRHGSSVTAVDFSPANHTVLTASLDGAIRIWSLAAAPTLVWSTNTAPGRSMTYGRAWGLVHELPQGVEIIGLKPGEVQFVNFPWRGKFAPSAGATLSRDGTKVLIPQELNGMVEYQLLDTASGHPAGPIFRLAGNAESIYGTPLSADGSRFVVRREGKLQAWDVIRGQPIGPEFAPDVRPSTPELSPDGKVLFWRAEGQVVVWDVDRGRERFTLRASAGRIFSMESSPDSQRLLTVNEGAGAELPSAQVWDAMTGRPTAPPIVHAAALNAAFFSPDGRRIVTASDDRTARVWDAQTSEPCTAAFEHPDPVQLATYSHDQSRIYTASDDGFVRVWDAETGEPLAAPLDHHHPVHYVTPLLGGRLLHSTSQHNHRWKPAEALARSLEEWEMLAQLLAARRVEASGRVQILEHTELLQLWQAISTRLPDEFTTSLARRVDWNNWMTQIFFANSHRNKALPYLNELVELQPDLFIHRWNRAYANKGPNRWDLAIDDFLVASRLDPSENAIWADLALAQLARGDLAGYRVACAKMGERLSAGDRRVHLGEWCMIACHASNPPELLQRLLDLLESLGPPPPSTIYMRGRDWQYYAGLGALVFRLGRFEEAQAHLEKASSLRDGDRTISLYLAMTQSRLGKKTEARALVERVRARIETDERLFDLGRSFDSHGGLIADRMLLKEADGLLQ